MSFESPESYPDHASVCGALLRASNLLVERFEPVDGSLIERLSSDVTRVRATNQGTPFIFNLSPMVTYEAADTTIWIPYTREPKPLAVMAEFTATSHSYSEHDGVMTLVNDETRIFMDYTHSSRPSQSGKLILGKQRTNKRETHDNNSGAYIEHTEVQKTHNRLSDIAEVNEVLDRALAAIALS